MWAAVAKRFATNDNVIAYELMNEPWVGDAIEHPDYLVNTAPTLLHIALRL